MLQKEHGLLLTPPKKQREDEWRGLEKVHHLQIKSEDTERCVFFIFPFIKY